jgi:hypothetical protein
VWTQKRRSQSGFSKTQGEHGLVKPKKSRITISVPRLRPLLHLMESTISQKIVVCWS